MKKATTCMTVSVFLLMLTAPGPVCGLSQFDLGARIGAGYTWVDFEEASDRREEYQEDCGEFHFKAAGYGLLPLGPLMSAGLEIGYNNLYWYYYRVPYVPSPIHDEKYWSTISFLGLLRVNLTDLFFVQTGAGLHAFIDDGSAFAVSAAAGIQPRINNISFPISVRIEPVFGKGTPTVFALDAGVEFSRR
ncbi:MAG: hypothetical protein JW768_02345 [Chitinispirillaceae bacterium]|nr:hypothetical protein [Chitinispirillaceae bacterium]